MGRSFLFSLFLILIISCSSPAKREVFYYYTIDSTKFTSLEAYAGMMEVLKSSMRLETKKKISSGEIKREQGDMDMIHFERDCNMWDLEQNARFEFYKNGNSLNEIDSLIKLTK